MIVTALLMSFASTTEATTLQVNGIFPFNTSLGTLTQVSVSIDPLLTVTSSVSSIPPIPSHVHLASPNPLPVPGLGSFVFPATPTSSSSGSAFGSHSHLANNTAAVKNFSGGGLAWFLNANPPINSVVISPFSTSSSESHTHTVNYPPVIPITIYTFDPAPVPEPGTCLLMVFGCCGMACSRRRKR